MRRNWLLTGGAAAIGLLVAYAWVDGGRQVPHALVVPVALPSSAPSSGQAGGIAQ